MSPVFSLLSFFCSKIRPRKPHCIDSIFLNTCFHLLPGGKQFEEGSSSPLTKLLIISHLEVFQTLREAQTNDVTDRRVLHHTDLTNVNVSS